MGKLRLLFITAYILLLPHICFSDIIVTKDGMTLNGKIIEMKDEHIKFGNYHGTFTIQNSLVKEIHKTENYQEDIKIFRQMGKAVSESDIRNNFQAGVKKLEERRISGDGRTDAATAEFLLSASPFFLFNLGKMRPLLPYSCGASLLGDVRFRSRYIYLPGTIRLDLHYFHSEKGMKKISAFRFGIGTAWIIPFEVRGVSFNLSLSPGFGGGYYAVTGRCEKAANFKWHVSMAAGLEFPISSWVISPQVKFDYIYDGAMPLFGLGFSIGAGYLFKI